MSVNDDWESTPAKARFAQLLQDSTNLQKRIYETYLKSMRIGDEYQVWMQVGVQGFRIGIRCENEIHANWFRLMFAKALSAFLHAEVDVSKDIGPVKLRMYQMESVISWILTDAAYKAPEQMGECDPIWLAKLAGLMPGIAYGQEPRMDLGRDSGVDTEGDQGGQRGVEGVAPKVSN